MYNGKAYEQCPHFLLTQEKAHLLRDCSAAAFDERVSTARAVRDHRLYGLVKSRSHQLGVALLTKPSEAHMPLSLPELALGDTMATASNRIRDLVRHDRMCIMVCFVKKSLWCSAVPINPVVFSCADQPD